MNVAPSTTEDVTAVQSQKAISVYFTSEQILPLGLKRGVDVLHDAAQYEANIDSTMSAPY